MHIRRKATLQEKIGVGGIRELIKKAGNLFATAYLLLIFCVYPFYMPDGYVNIGETKHKFLVYCSLGGLMILLALRIAQGVTDMWRRHCRKEAYLVRWDQIRISATDIFVVLYGIEITISYVLSGYRQEALWGTEGWRIGFVLQLALCGLYLMISRMWKGDSWIWYGIMAASGAVFLLGILDRFSVYLIPLELRNPGFISTLGNINWFCGYLSVLSPIGACLFLFGKRPAAGWASGLYLAVAFMAGFAQGSSSVFLFFGGLFFITLWIAVSKREWVGRWLLMGALWGFSAQAVRIMRALPGLNYNYSTDNACAYFTGSWLLAVAAAVCFLPGILLLRTRKGRDGNGKGEVCRKIRWLLVGISVAAVLAWGMVTLVNTKWGIPGLAGRESVFLFHDGWGNGRGATWKVGAAAFGRMDPGEKLFGVGTDCFSVYVYSQPQIAAALRAYFGESRLTNAHNELLTSLVNVGITGTVLYMGAFVSGICRCLKRAGKNSCLLIPAVCVFCYLIHNMVSFAQVLNFPFAFLLMAMGEGMARLRNGEAQGWPVTTSYQNGRRSIDKNRCFFYNNA